MLVILFGAKTRLAQAILALPWARGQKWVLVARDPGEAAALGRAHPASRVLCAGHPWEAPPDPPEAVVVLGCALGPIHKDARSWDADLEAAHRDLDVVAGLLGLYPGVPLRIVFLSSVLSLAPRPERRYYAGWKCLLEGALRAMIAGRAGSSLCVVYPGRCVDRSAWASGLYTTYAVLARRVVAAAEGSSGAFITGVDARSWLVLQRIRKACAAMVGRP